MTKREFNTILKGLTTLNPRLVASLDPITKERVLQHVVRHRGPILWELVDEVKDSSWLASMGYCQKTKSPSTDLVFLHTSEHTIR